jgi:hypothetical protein
MTRDEGEDNLLELLRFELKFLEDGGYGRSPRTPWRPSNTFQDSPVCLNFDDPARPHPCDECMIVQFVPAERRNEKTPCWFIPLSLQGDTVNYYSNCGTQQELEEALGTWLRDRIKTIEQRRAIRIAHSGNGEEELIRIAGT